MGIKELNFVKKKIKMKIIIKMKMLVKIIMNKEIKKKEEEKLNFLLLLNIAEIKIYKCMNFIK